MRESSLWALKLCHHESHAGTNVPGETKSKDSFFLGCVFKSVSLLWEHKAIREMGN